MNMNWRTPPRLDVVSPAAEAIIQEVCDKHKIAKRHITGPQRARQFIKPRFEAMWRIWTETGATLSQIGKMFDDRHHTSCLYAIRRYQETLKRETNAQT